jgi:peptide-methionine (S)-S-oxide reductase
MAGKNKVAVFGAGCFWGVESAFRAIEGVVDVAVGYAGGNVPKPSYRMVCTGKTGHAEVVQVEYDPARVSFEQLLDVFWQIHDPTTLNRQGPDVGTQYRSVIFYSDEQERKAAEESKRRLDESGKLRRPVVTQIVPAAEFYRAEEYHQRYYERMGIAPACHVVRAD